MSDPVTEDYLRLCQKGESGLSSVMSEVELPPTFGAVYGQRFLARPVFLDSVVMTRFSDDLSGLFDLLVSLPQRLFGGDLLAYCAHLGIGRRRAELLRRFATPPVRYGRADVYRTENAGLKVLELNLGSRTGGPEMAELNRALLAVPAFSAFADDHQLSYVDTAERLAESLRSAVAAATGAREPVAAVVDTGGILADHLPIVRSLEETLGGHGIEFVFADVSELTHVAGRVHARGRPVDVILRYLTDEEIVADAETERVFAMLHRADADGEVVLWTSLHSELYANKACLALLSNPLYRHEFTAEEGALVDRILPWTRLLAAGRTVVDGGEVDLPDYCRQHRADLILKPQSSFGGHDVLAGWECTDTEWAEALDERAGSGHVVQQRVSPAAEPVIDPATGDLHQWSTLLGTFLTPQGYGGAMVRALPRELGAVIGIAINDATLTTVAFTAPEAPGTGTGHRS